MSFLAFIVVSIAALRWLDLPATTLIVVSPLVVALSGVAGLAAGVA